MHVTVCSHCFLQQDRASRPVMGERQQSRRINSELHDISDFIWRLLLAFTNQKPTSLATMLANACLPRLAACCSFQHCRNHDLCSVHVACLIDTQAVSPPLWELTFALLGESSGDKFAALHETNLHRAIALMRFETHNRSTVGPWIKKS